MHGKLRIYILMMTMLVWCIIAGAPGWLVPAGTMAAPAETKTTIFPTEGSRVGGESVTIQGKAAFTDSTIAITRPTRVLGGGYNLTMPVVVIKDWDNLEKPADSALLTNQPWPQVELPGGITVTLKAANQVNVTIVRSGVTYQADYLYTLGHPIFINTKDLLSSNAYFPFEDLIRISDDSATAAAGSQYLYAEAGYAGWARLRTNDPRFIDLKTPWYHGIGAVEFEIRNPGSTSESIGFTYYEPLSNPQITNILREGQGISAETINGSTVRPIKVNYKGGHTITITGYDFRENITVKIGDLTTIAASAINRESSERISFKVPAASVEDIGRLFLLQVLNEDGGLALSTELNPPFYLQYTQGIITPAITKVSPAQGFACGGNQVTIEGKDFRRPGGITGYNGSLSVSFGGVRVPDSDITYVNDKTLLVKVPANTAGKKDVLVENPDGELAVLADGYTYISMPVITSIQISNTNITTGINQVNLSGGQEIIIKGSGFMPGAKAVFGPGEPQIIAAISASTSFVYLPRDTSLDLSYNRFEYQGGVEWTNVVFVDSQTLKVTVPAGQLSGAGIMVVNPDLGASEIYKDISYTMAELPVVKNVVAELLNNRSIKIHWDAVAGAAYYEVYCQIDGDEPEVLGTTRTTAMVFEKYRDHARYCFLVKARNDSAISMGAGYSNQLYTYQNGRGDLDGTLTEKTSVNPMGSQVMVRIGQEIKWGPFTLNLQNELAGAKEVVIAIPAELISSGEVKDIQVIGPDFRLRFNPVVFRGGMLGSELSGGDNGVRFSLLAAAAPYEKGVTMVSRVYQLSACAYSGSQQRPLEYLAGDIQFNLSSYPVRDAAINKIKLARWQDNRDGTEHSWIGAKGSLNLSSRQGAFSTNRLGIFAIIEDRRLPQ